MSVISFLIGAINSVFYNWSGNLSQIIHLICCFLLFLPLSASLILPLYALNLLLKDLIHFYFTGHNPGYPSRLFNPRFGLTGIAFSPDESENIKKDIIEYEYSSDLINFVLPFDEKEASYFDKVKENTKDLIIPDSRTRQTLKEQYNLDYTDFAKSKQDIDKLVDIDRFNTALGLAGFLDRPLFQEVAKIETSLVRHTLCLRRLVLRYMKALLMFIITMLISFLTVSIIQNLSIYGVYIFAIGYLVWAFSTPKLIRKPVDCIWELSNHNIPNDVGRDEQLVMFENKVKDYCNIVILILILVLTLKIISDILSYNNR